MQRISANVCFPLIADIRWCATPVTPSVSVAKERHEQFRHASSYDGGRFVPPQVKIQVYSVFQRGRHAFSRMIRDHRPEHPGPRLKLFDFADASLWSAKTTVKHRTQNLFSEKGDHSHRFE